MNVVEAEINDAAVKAILRRYASSARGASLFQSPDLDDSDWEHLHFYWATSYPIKSLITHILENPREAKSVLVMNTVVTQGDISGVLDARASVIEQMVSGDPSRYVLSQPLRSYAFGPNHLVAWVLKEAQAGIQAVLGHNPKGLPVALADSQAIIHDIEQILRVRVFKEIALSLDTASKPGASAVRMAAKSRVPLYKKALEAFHILDRLESGEQAFLADFLSNVVLGGLDAPQKFELATGLLCMNALGEALGVQPKLQRLLKGGKDPIASVGRFDIYWQFTTPALPDIAMEPSELRVKGLLKFLGIEYKGSRTDIVITSRASNTVLAIVECKYFLDESSAVRATQAAVSQIVRYARELLPTGVGLDSLIRNSLVVTVDKGALVEKMSYSDPKHLIGHTDFRGMIAGSLVPWAKQIASLP